MNKCELLNRVPKAGDIAKIQSYFSNNSHFNVVGHLEAGVRDLVIALNCAGFPTRYSCEGHPQESSMSGRSEVPIVEVVTVVKFRNPLLDLLFQNLNSEADVSRCLRDVRTKLETLFENCFDGDKTSIVLHAPCHRVGVVRLEGDKSKGSAAEMHPQYLADIEKFNIYIRNLLNSGES